MNWFQRTFEVSHNKHNSIRTMEGLRGFAVFFVFLVHYVSLIEPWLVNQSLTHQLGMYLKNIGNSGVDLFFVLSGYLIYGTLIKKEKPFLPYMRRRIQRIYPTFLAVFSLYIILSFVFPIESKLPDGVFLSFIYIIENLLLLPGLFKIDPIITVAWSLSYELFFYLLIPAVLFALGMRKWSSDARLLFFLAVSLTGFVFFWFQNEHIRLLMFVAGIVLYETLACTQYRPSPISGLFAIVVACVAMIAILDFKLSAWFRFITLYLSIFLLCWDCFTSSSMISKLFSFAPLRWYGNMSYSYYLIHGLTLKGFFLILALTYPSAYSTDELFWIMLLPMFIATLITATILFIFIEKPYSLSKIPISVYKKSIDSKNT
jgi:exopolysaccharide production protein ExoZ